MKRHTVLATRWARGLATTVLLVASTALSLCAVEWLARRLDVRSNFGRLIPVRDMPTRTVGDVVVWSDAAPRYDAEDLRLAMRSREAFTILGLGDSIMFGVGQERGATYLEQARRRLAASGAGPVAIVNLAVPGFNTRQENAVYEEIGNQLHPDLVIVHYWADDTRQYRQAGGHVIDYGDISEDGRFVVRALPLPAAWSDYLLVHSRIYGLLTEFVVRQRSTGSETDWRNVAGPLAAIQARAARAGARLLVLASAELDGATPRPVYDLPVLREFARKQGFEVIDLSEWLKGESSSRIAMDGCHFNAEGHRLIGERLAEYLLAHDLKERGGA